MAAITYTPEFVERGYNNRAAVAGPSAVARALHRGVGGGPRGARSEARSALRSGTEGDARPVPAAGTRTRHVRVPARRLLARVRQERLLVRREFVRRAGIRRRRRQLRPVSRTFRSRAIVDECRRAVAWVVRDGAAHGANPDRVVVGGHSAGGHLTAMLFTTDWSALGLARDPIAGGVSVSGVHDLAPMVQFSYNADLRLDDAEAARQSPVRLAPRSRAPLVLAAGADETSEFVRQTRILWDAWPRNRPAGAQRADADPRPQPLQRGRRLRGRQERTDARDARAVLARACRRARPSASRRTVGDGLLGRRVHLLGRQQHDGLRRRHPGLPTASAIAAADTLSGRSTMT